MTPTKKATPARSAAKATSTAKTAAGAGAPKKKAPSAAPRAVSGNGTKAAATAPAAKVPAKAPAKTAAKAPAKTAPKAPAKKAAKAPAATTTKKPATKPVPATTTTKAHAAKAVTGAAKKHASAAPTTKAPAKSVATKKVAAAPAPAKKVPIGPYASDEKFLAEQLELLAEERAIYVGQAADLKAEADSLAQERKPGDVQFDEESGEGGTVAVDRERDLALSAQALLAVEEIDDAVVRVQKKTYGACERCHEPIPKPRLRALPYARLCVACKSGGLSRR